MSIDLPLAADIYLAVLLFLFGACMGSFVTCAADRYVAKESVLRGRSKCPVCGHTLSALELVPIFSWLFLRGRCRKCGAPIPVRCFFTELLGGLAFAAIYLRYGFGFITLEYMAIFCALLAIALIDYDTMEIPDGLTVFIFAVFVLFLYPHSGSVGAMTERAKSGLFGALAYGGGLLVLSLVMDLLLGKETLGGGDVKLFAALGLCTGLAGGLLLVLVSCVGGLLVALSVRKGKKKEFPFGPAISAAAVFVLLIGEDFVNWYLSLIS